VYRRHANAGFDQRIDEYPGGPIYGDGEAAAALEASQLADQPLEAFSGVLDLQAKLHAASDVEHANAVRLAGRPCVKLIDRRSGFSYLAQRPVSRSSLPAPAAERVSYGPSSGQRTWLSQEVHGSLSATASPRSSRVKTKVAQ